MSRSRLTVTVGLVTLVQALMMIAPLAILGPAIDWPASLDLPSAEVLPLIGQAADDVRLGYGLYLAYSLAWAVVGPALAWALLDPGRRDSPLFTVSVAVIGLSALARAIGILRWLSASPELAAQYEGADPAAAQTLAIVQGAINQWGGAIGEYIGVAILTSIWLVCLSLLIIGHRQVAPWLGWAGLVVAPLLASPAGELFGWPASIFVSTVVFHLWLLVLAIALVRARPVAAA